MVVSHLQALRSLLARLAPAREADVDIECKHFFSGAAAYANGRIFMTLTPVGLALKLPERARAELMKKGATPLRYFPKAPIKQDYVLIPDTLAADEAALTSWTEDSIRFSQDAAKAR